MKTIRKLTDNYRYWSGYGLYKENQCDKIFTHKNDAGTRTKYSKQLCKSYRKR